MRPPAIIIPVAPADCGTVWENNELRFCLRSIARHWLPKSEVVVIGKGLPDWINPNKVTKVEAPGSQGKAFAFAISRWDRFIWFNDDQYLLLDSTLRDFDRARHDGDLSGFGIFDRLRRTTFEQRLWRSVDLLESRGITPIFNFATHTPDLMESGKLEALDLPGPWADYVWEVLYFNTYRQPLMELDEDSIIHHPPTMPDFPPQPGRHRFLNHNDAGLDDRTKAFLRERFPDPCKFEK